MFVGDGDVNGIRDAEDNGYGEEDKSNDYEGEEDGRRGGWVANGAFDWSLSVWVESVVTHFAYDKLLYLTCNVIYCVNYDPVVLFWILSSFCLFDLCMFFC